MGTGEEKHTLSLQRGLEFTMNDGAKITEVEAFGQAQTQMLKEGHFVTGVGACDTDLVSVSTSAEFEAKLAEVKASGAQEVVVATMPERPIHKIERTVAKDGTAVVGTSLDGPSNDKASLPKRGGAKKDIVFVLGGPGSGKGTQCAKLVDMFGYCHLSAGDLLRAEVASQSPTAELINSYIADGKIVPSEITVALLKKAIDTAKESVVLVDGFPRALDQIDEFLRIVGVDCAFVLFFDCNEELLTKRLLKRGETSGRADDNLASIEKRFVTFREQSYPVVEKYEALGKVKRVDSSKGTPDDVFALVASIFQGIGTDAAAASQPKPTRKASWQEKRALSKAAKQEKRTLNKASKREKRDKKLEAAQAAKVKDQGSGEQAKGKRRLSFRRSRPPPPSSSEK